MNSGAKFKLLYVFIALTILINFSSTKSNTAFALENSPIKVLINNNEITFEKPLLIKDNRVFVPIKIIFENLGSVVFFSGDNNKIIALSRDGDYIQHQIGLNTALINGDKKEIVAYSFIYNNTAYVPIRFVANLLCADIYYDEKNGAIFINKIFLNRPYNIPIEELLKYSDLPYFNPELFKRYLEYKYNHKQISDEQVIINVNIGLDNPFNTNIKTTKNPHDLLAICNKYNKLPDNYVPYNIVSVPKKYHIIDGGDYKLSSGTLNAFVLMFNDAKTLGLNIKVISSFRTNEYQMGIYNSLLLKNGKSFADKYSATAGQSEHQTGLAVDINNESSDFDNTLECRWLKSNAYKYGFILRYPKDKENVTGYEYEPWHYRYVGIEVATKIYNEKITFDEFCAKYLKQSDYSVKQNIN